jgi:hypothetical protein
VAAEAGSIALWLASHCQNAALGLQNVQRLPPTAGACGSSGLPDPPQLRLARALAGDSEQQANLDYFLKHGVEAQDWLRYRIVIASGAGVLVGGTCQEWTLYDPCSVPRLLFASGCRRHLPEFELCGDVLKGLLVDDPPGQALLVLQAPRRQPDLPPNAAYIHSSACTAGTWGILAGKHCSAVPLV